MPFDSTTRVAQHTADSLLLERAMQRITKRKNWCRFAMSRRGWFSREPKYCMLGAVHAEGDCLATMRVVRALALTIDPTATDYTGTVIQFNDGNIFRRSRHRAVLRVMQRATETLKTVNTRWSRYA